MHAIHLQGRDWLQAPKASRVPMCCRPNFKRSSSITRTKLVDDRNPSHTVHWTFYQQCCLARPPDRAPRELCGNPDALSSPRAAEDWYSEIPSSSAGPD